MKKLCDVFVWILFGIMFWIPKVSHAQSNISFLNLTHEDGLAHHKIWMIAKDHTGFIWMATANGLQRFDGYQFQTFKKSKKKNALKSNMIRCVFVDHQNTLWVGTRGGGLSRYVNGKFETFLHDPKNPESLSQNDVEVIAEDQEGNIWIGTRKGGLCKFKDGKFTRFMADSTDKNALSHNAVLSLLIDKKGTLWAGTFGGGLNRMNPDGTFTNFSHDPTRPESISGNYVVALMEDRHANLWVGTWQDGLNKFHNNTFERIQMKNSAINNNCILSIIESKSGAIWLGTWGSGLIKYQNGAFTVYKKHECNSHTLANNYIEHLFEDDQGTIWVSTYSGGISRLVQRPFHTFKAYTGTNSLQNEYVSGVCKTSDGALWIGTLGGGLHQYKNGQMRVFRHADQEANTIWCITKFKNAIWLGTDKGLLRFKDGRFKHYKFPATSSAKDLTFVLCKVSENELLIGTWEGAVYRLKDEKITMVSSPKEVRKPVTALLQDSQKRLWIARQENGGLEQITNGKTTLFLHDENDPKSLLDNNPRSIFQDSQKRVWIGSEDGLSLYDNKAGFISYAQFYPELSVQIQSMQEDQLGYLWLGTDDGLVRFHPDKNTLKRYATHDGLAGTIFSMGASYKDENQDILYFGAIEGLSVIDPKKLAKNVFPKKPILFDFQIFNQSVEARFKQPMDQLKEIHLTHHENVFTFVLTSLDYTNEKKQYQYFLEGFEDKYNPPSTRRFATYTSIPYGEYFFKARQVGGLDELSIKVVIHPPFWQLLEFKSIIILIVIIALVSFYRYRIYNANKREKELKQKVEVHTVALIKEREHAQQKADKLQELNEELIFMTKELRQNTEELNATNQQLTEAEGRMRQLLENEKEQRYVLQKTHDSLVEAQTQLVQSEKMASLGVLTAGIAHEINNPVNFISAGTEILKRNFKDIITIFHRYNELHELPADQFHHQVQEIETLKNELEIDRELIEETTDLLQDVETGAVRITEIVKGLRTFSRLDEGNVKLTDIHENINSTLVILRTQYKGRIEIIRDYDAELPMIECHSGKLNQVFMNLIVNSIQAIEDEGKIYISTQKHHADSIKIDIKDTGKGISQEIKKHIFEPFFTTKEVGKGTGLGLSISHGIIKNHHGTISVQSEENLGTTFTIILPLTQLKDFKDE